MSMHMPDYRNNQGFTRRGWACRVHRGLTMMELVVAISIFVLVIGLLGFPLYSAFGYIQKAIAQSEALSAGKQAVTQLRHELSDADYVCDLPPTGEWVSLLFAEKQDDADFGFLEHPDGTVKLVRFARLPDFPWVWEENGNTWELLQPGYMAPGSNYTYDKNHLSFYEKNDGQPLNPFILGRNERGGMYYASAVNVALNGSYPMDTYNMPASQPDGKRYQAALLRQFRNDYVSITPYGEAWDVSRFQTTPMRLVKEALARPVSSSAICTAVTAKYPLWSGRNLDQDTLSNADLVQLYGMPAGDLWDVIEDDYTLYSQEAGNPFGYRIEVYDSNGNMVYPFNALNSPSTIDRHFMDWPPVDRPDLVSGSTFSTTAWSIDDIRQQRDEGKVVFEQPYQAANMDVNVTASGTYYLPIPDWDDYALTYLVQPPHSIVVNGVTYKLVDKNNPGANEFCFVNRIAGLSDARAHGTRISAGTPGWQLASREIKIGSLADATITIGSARYTVCDLQPGDVVVATYSTRGMLDVGLTLSRQDRSGAKLEDSRQNYAVTLRLEASNAMRRARRSE